MATAVLSMIHSPPSMFAQEMEVPVQVQFPLFLKILSFDRNLRARVGNEIVFAVIYQAKFRRSLNVHDNLLDVFDKETEKGVENIPLRVISIDLERLEELPDVLKNNQVDIMYLAPLRAMPIDAIADIGRALNIITLSGVPAYCLEGIAVGIGSRGGNPLIIINRVAARAQGADFSSRLLSRARVIDQD